MGDAFSALRTRTPAFSPAHSAAPSVAGWNGPACLAACCCCCSPCTVPPELSCRRPACLSAAPPPSCCSRCWWPASPLVKAASASGGCWFGCRLLRQGSCRGAVEAALPQLGGRLLRQGPRRGSAEAAPPWLGGRPTGAGLPPPPWLGGNSTRCPWCSAAQGASTAAEAGASPSSAASGSCAAGSAPLALPLLGSASCAQISSRRALLECAGLPIPAGGPMLMAARPEALPKCGAASPTLALVALARGG